MKIGERLKNRRIKLGLTQEELADRAELTKGFISQVERDLSSPSIESLSYILEALGTDLASFFRKEKNTQVFFTDEDFFVAETEDGLTTTWVVPNAQKNSMEPILIELEKGCSKEVDPAESEDFGYVLEGEVLVRVGEEEQVLKAGECFYTDCRYRRMIENKKKQAARILWISNPPIF